jgi:hypothetical protein
MDGEAIQRMMALHGPVEGGFQVLREAQTELAYMKTLQLRAWTQRTAVHRWMIWVVKSKRVA